MQHVSFTRAEQWWKVQQWGMPMVQSGHTVVRKTYTTCPVSSATKFWKGFDSEMRNQFQVKENVSLMLSHPRVKFLAWLSTAPHSDITERGQSGFWCTDLFAVGLWSCRWDHLHLCRNSSSPESLLGLLGRRQHPAGDCGVQRTGPDNIQTLLPPESHSRSRHRHELSQC